MAALGEPDSSARPVPEFLMEAGEPAGGSAGGNSSGGPDDAADAFLLRDVDVILARVKDGIAAENTAMDALLARPAKSA